MVAQVSGDLESLAEPEEGILLNLLLAVSLKADTTCKCSKVFLFSASESPLSDGAGLFIINKMFEGVSVCPDLIGNSTPLDFYSL